MTGADFRPRRDADTSPQHSAHGSVDLDLLADYVAGVLDGADEAAVAALIEREQVWSDAYAAVVAADAAMAERLRAYAAEPAEPMPTDVATRLEAALLAAEPARVVSLEEARRRRRPWKALAGAAAALIAIAGGVSLATGLVNTPDRSAEPSTAQGAGLAGAPDAPGEAAGSAAQPMAPDSEQSSPIAMIASGTDYRPDTLSSIAAKSPALGVSPAPKAPSGPPGAAQSREWASDAPAELARLTDPAALAGCLRAVTISHPGQVTTVDFARYQSMPALVVLVTPGPGVGGGAAEVVVVGAACGPGNADERASAPVR